MPNYSLQNGKQRVICGHLGKDPEIVKLKSTQFAKFSVAVSGRQQVTKEDGSKEWVDQPTTWFSCKAFGTLADVAQFNFSKGSAVMIAGHDDSWEGKDGRVFTDLVCEVIAKPISITKASNSTYDRDNPF